VSRESTACAIVDSLSHRLEPAANARHLASSAAHSAIITVHQFVCPLGTRG